MIVENNGLYQMQIQCWEHCSKCQIRMLETVEDIKPKVGNNGAVKHESGKHRKMLHSNERLSGKCQILQINSGKQWKISNLNVGINMRCLKTVDVRPE